MNAKSSTALARASAAAAAPAAAAAESRISIVDGADRLVVSIPAKRQAGIVAYYAVFLPFWCLGELAGIARLFFLSSPLGLGDTLLTLGWLLTWSSGGLAVLQTLGWQLAGREIIMIRSGTLSVRREIFGIGRTRSYDCAGIRNLRYCRPGKGGSPRSIAMMEALGLLGHTIVFEHGKRRHHCGTGLDEDEAYQILTPIVAHL